MASTSTDPAVGAADGLQKLSLSPAAPKGESPSSAPMNFTLPNDAVCVSAPGKVLMAGGYLVLERQHEGLVLATSSRFYCVAAGTRSAASSSTADPKSAPITISASQFPAECSWSYRVNLVTYPAPVKSIPDNTPWPESLAYLDLDQTNPENGKNKFVEIALAKTLQLALETISEGEEYKGDNEKAGVELLRRMRGSGGGMEAFVMADNDFYSQREQLAERNLPRRISSLTQLPPFNPLPRPIHQINKTGLGSSAALTTSLTAALLSYLGIISLPSSSSSPTPEETTSLDTVHALAQLTHCLAQGKVGSGFDVSSAVYGSHAYRRFSPAILTPLMSSPHLPIRAAKLKESLARDKWDQTTAPLRLPKGLRLVLADVDAGTDTPSFVNKVLWWKVEQAEEAGRMWASLAEANGLLRQHLEGLCSMEEDEGYTRFMEESAEKHMEDLDRDTVLGKQLYRVYSTLFCLRQLFRLVTAASKVPVEPAEQSRVLNASMKTPGVVGGGVPGAGGFDALFLLVVDTPTVLEAVQDLWEGWTEMSLCPLLARQSDGGLVKVDVGEVAGLKEGIAGWEKRKLAATL